MCERGRRERVMAVGEFECVGRRCRGVAARDVERISALRAWITQIGSKGNGVIGEGE